MVSVFLDCTSDERDEVIAEMYALGTTGIVENDCEIEVFFDETSEAEAVAAQYAARNPRIKEHGNRDYVAEFQAHWQALAIGKRIWLAPSWDASPTPDGRVRLEYQPGMACGSGAHPCTQLCLEALDQFCGDGITVLDVGVGSGILLMAARLLGAKRTFGCDIDHDAVVLAGLATQSVFTGSLDAVRDRCCDIVIANISSVAAEELAADLRRVCKPGGVVVVSGFRSEDVPSGFNPALRRDLDGWSCVHESMQI